MIVLAVPLKKQQISFSDKKNSDKIIRTPSGFPALLRSSFKVKEKRKMRLSDRRSFFFKFAPERFEALRTPFAGFNATKVFNSLRNKLERWFRLYFSGLNVTKLFTSVTY
jgi:hypothetical protein